MKVRQRDKGSWRVTHWNKPELEVVAAVLRIDDPRIYWCRKFKQYVLSITNPEHKQILKEWKKDLEKAHTRKS